MMPKWNSSKNNAMSNWFVASNNWDKAFEYVLALFIADREYEIIDDIETN